MLKAVLSKLGTLLDEFLLGSVVTLCRANRRVSAKILACQVTDYKDDKRLVHAEERLADELDVSIKRVERIETKASSTILGVGIAVTIVGSASGLLGPNGTLGASPSGFRVAVAILLICATLYLLGSGFLALQAYTIGEVYRLTSFNYEPLVDPDRRAMMQLYCTEQNIRIGTRRSNWLSASFSCLRSGLAAVSILAILLIGSSLLGSSESVETDEQAEPAATCKCAD